MSADNTDFNHLIDVSSSLGVEEGDTSIKDILSMDYEFFSSYIDDLYFIEANMVYMNYVCDVPQMVIADIFNMRQYGVSKRIYSAFRRLSIRMKAPDSNLSDSYNFLSKILPKSQAYILTIWYSLKTVISVAKTAKASGLSVTQALKDSEEILRELYQTNTLEDFKYILTDNMRLKDIDIEFLKSLEDKSNFLVVKHKIGNHLKYIEELINYNSRGSHSFRKDWIGDGSE